MIALSALRSERGGEGGGGGGRGLKITKGLAGTPGHVRETEQRWLLSFLAGKGRRFKLAMAVNFFLNRLTVFFFCVSDFTGVYLFI